MAGASPVASRLKPCEVFRIGGNFLNQGSEHALEMHPQDATPRGIRDGERVLLFNDQGKARVPVHLSQDLVPGVVSLLEGIWVALDTEGVDTVGSANMFTSSKGTTPSKSCIMNGVPVDVRR